MSAEPPALVMSGLVKTFGATRALDGASLSVAHGSVHGLVGQNGAGKSTLIKVLAGLVPPEAGRIELAGRRVEQLSPARAEDLGVTFIHQDRLLSPTATVGEALYLGRESSVSRFGVWRGQLDRRAAEALDLYFGASLPRGALIRDLTTAQQQLVQITRALLSSPKILVFDEPTAALAKREVDSLFEAIARLKRHGVTTIYISHYLAEIERICDRVTVMRNGRDVADVALTETSVSEITRLMVGRDIRELFPRHKAKLGSALLTATRLSLPPQFHDVSFSLRRGEVLGLTGLQGSGAKDLVRALFGLEKPAAGALAREGTPLRHARSPHAASKNGLAYLPEDRRAQGVALGLSVRENVTLASLGRVTRLGWLNRKQERARVTQLIADLSIKTPDSETPVRSLSGGNQQKVALAKWLARKSDVYVLDEPTVGVDVAAKAEIYRLIADLAERGAGVLLLSSDLQELLGVSDRILVMYRGRIVAERRQSETSADELLKLAVAGGREDLSHVA